jgi:hypothetical protein
MIERLFPAAQRFTGGSRYGESWTHGWLKGRRVAHEAVLRLYLERVPGERLLAFGAAELAFARMADADALDGYLRSLDKDRVEDVIASLEAYESDFSKEHVVTGVAVLLNLLPDIPQRERGFFSIDTRLVVTRVVYRLLRSLRDPSAVETAVREILPQLQSLSAKFEVILDVGYQEGAGHKLVSENAATEFERGLRDEIRAASVDDLTKENRLLRLLLFARQTAEPSEEQLTIDSSPTLTLAILQDARSDAIRQSMGSRAVRRSPRLAWDALVLIYNDESALKERIKALKKSRALVSAEEASELLQLADKYLSGWRPDDFQDN